MPDLTTIRNWAHSFAAIVGILGVAYAAVVNVLATSGFPIATQYANWIGAVGAILVAASKAIDSLNAALLGILPSTPVTVVPAVIPPV